MSEELWTPERGGFYVEKQTDEEPRLYLLSRFDHSALRQISLEAMLANVNLSQHLLTLQRQFPPLQVSSGGEFSLIDLSFVDQLPLPIELPFEFTRVRFYGLTRELPPSYLTEDRQLKGVIFSPLIDSREIARELFTMEENNQLNLNTIHQVLDYYITVVVNTHF